MLSTIDIFKIGIGPSSSHTVGPMKIAKLVLEESKSRGFLDSVQRLTVDLHGSLALTGKGHGTDKAVMLGLDPATVDPDEAEVFVAELQANQKLALLGGNQGIPFDPSRDINFRSKIRPTIHPNEMRIIAYDAQGEVILDEIRYSIGGGFIASKEELSEQSGQASNDERLFPFRSAAELLAMCADQGATITDIVLTNEDGLRPRSETWESLDAIWQAMNRCIERGLMKEAILPGGLGVRRRACGLVLQKVAKWHGQQ